MNLLSSLLKYTADQIAALRAKDSSQDTTVSGINTRLTTAEGDIDSLEAQFTTVVSAVTTDTEVTNIRVGDDGVTYDTAGNAVRKQFFDVKSDLLETEIARHISFASANIDVGYYINSSGVKASSDNYSMTKPFAVKHGEVVTVNARAASTTALIAQYDGTNYLPLAFGTGAYAEAVFNVPEDMNIVVSYVNWDDYDTKCVVRFNPTDNIDAMLKYTSKKTPSYSVVTGKYISSDGTESSNVNYDRTTPFDVFKDDVIVVKARANTGIAVISEYSDGLFFPLVLGTNDYSELTYTATKNTKIVLSYVNWSEIKPQLTVYGDVKLIQNDVNSLSDVAFGKEILFESVSGEYVNPDTKVITSNPAFDRSVPIAVTKGQLVKLTGRGYLTAVGMIATCSSSGTIYKVPCVSIDSTVREYRYLVEEDGYIMVSYHPSYDHILQIGSEYSNEALRAMLGDRFDYGLFSMIETFGVIGDSWSSGVIYRQNSGSDDENTFRNLSWGKILARNTGADCTLYSTGGATTRTWLTNSQYGLPKLLSDNAKQLYIVMLGINDSNTLGADYLGSLSDIASDDYATYPDTFYGNYGKIVGNIKTHASNAKIVLITAPNKDEVRASYNSAIEAIANRFGIVCIKMHEDEYFNSDYFTQYVNGHPVAVTYSGMAKRFEKLIVDTFDTQFAYWKDYIG